MVVLLAAAPYIVGSQWMSVFYTINYYILAALGVQLLIGYCGQITLGHAAFVAVGGYTSAMMVLFLPWPQFMVDAGLVYPISIVCAGFAAALWSVLFGLPSARVKGFYLIMTTMAAQWITLRLVITQLSKIGGREQSFPLPPGIIKIGPWVIDSDEKIYYFSVILVLICLVAMGNLLRSKMGRAWIAIRDNDIAAETMGVNIVVYKLLAFFVSGFFAGIAGAFWISALFFVSPENYEWFYSLLWVGIILIGGVGSIQGALTYADAGVDINKANDLVHIIKQLAKTTPRSGVMGEIGGFGGLFSLNLSHYAHPVLVSSTDGVGTKLKIAFAMGKHDTIGIDLVAMCVNDIVVQGAKPLFFLDYLAMGKLNNEVAGQIIEGIVKGCCEAQCALIGGETAEMPGIYHEGEYDMAGFTVGIVDNSKIIDGSEIRNGHKLIGLASSGVHSNGFSLVRKICFEKCGYTVETHIPELGKTLGEELLTPTRIYTQTVLGLIRDLPVHGLAHITGGGIDENIIRVIPDACKVLIRKGSWEIPPVFKLLQDAGGVEESEMHRTFNNGIGMIAVVPESSAQDFMDRLNAMEEKAYIIGEIASRTGSEVQVEWI